MVRESFSFIRLLFHRGGTDLPQGVSKPEFLLVIFQGVRGLDLHMPVVALVLHVHGLRNKKHGR